MQDLAGTAEIARMLGVSRQRVYQITAKADFPAPECILEMGKVWDGAKVRAWAASHGRSVIERG